MEHHCSKKKKNITNSLPQMNTLSYTVLLSKQAQLDYQMGINATKWNPQLSEWKTSLFGSPFISSYIQGSVVKVLEMKRHPPPVGFDFDSQPPKSPDTSNLSSGRIEVSSWVLVRDSPNNRSPSQLGHSLNPSGLAVLVKSRSKEKMGMSHDSSSPKLNV